MQYRIIEVFVKSPSQIVLSVVAEGARGSDWKEWLWSDSLCQFDIEKSELNELKVLEGGEKDIGAGGWEDGLEMEVRGRMREYKSEIETRPIGLLY